MQPAAINIINKSNNGLKSFQKLKPTGPIKLNPIGGAPAVTNSFYF